MQDWRDIYQRELNEAPPPEAFLAGYFEYEAPGGSHADPEDDGELIIDLPEFES